MDKDILAVILNNLDAKPEEIKEWFEFRKNILNRATPEELEILTNLRKELETRPDRHGSQSIFMTLANKFLNRK